MKQRISISVDETTVQAIKELIHHRHFRNRSHAVEYAIKRMFFKKR